MTINNRIQRCLLICCVLISTVLFTRRGITQDQTDFPRVPENWSVKKVAEYPEIKYPTVVEVAPDGRVFVGEDPKDMPGPVGEPIDRIVCFHPDGRKTVVADNLHAVFGLLYLDGKLYVNHPPEVTVLDVDGGRATSRKTLIESLGKEPWQWGFNDHIPAQIRLGMDGFIYMSVGDKGIYKAEGQDGSTATLHGGGVFRFRPDATDLEVYASGTRNHLDVAVNSQDEMFTYDNTDDGNGWWTRVTHMVDGGFYGYPHDYKPREPYTLWMMNDYGGGSPTGAYAYTGARLPEKYHEDLFMCEWGKQAVERFEVSRSGATFEIDSRERFFGRKDDTFTPISIELAESGTSFYVSDWDYSGWTDDKKRGQLFKMTYSGETQDVSKPEWYTAAGIGESVDVSTDRLIEEGLAHPAKRVRMVAQHQLSERGKEVIQPIVRLLKSSGVPPHAKWHGIWTLDAIDAGHSARDLIIDLSGPNQPASVRRQAMRQLGTREVKRAAEVLVKYLDDENASIRFWAATALGRIGHASAVENLLNALDESDLFTRYAVFKALNRIGRTKPEAWYEIADGFNARKNSIRTGTRFAMRETYMLKNVQALSNVVQNGDHMAARKSALKTLTALLLKRKPWNGDWWGTQPIKKGPRPKTEEWEGTHIVRNTLDSVLNGKSKRLKKIVIENGSKVNMPGLVPLFMQEYNQTQNRSMKTLLLKALSNLPDKRALDVYLDGLSSEDEQVRASSRDALRAISSGVRGEVIKKARSGAFTDEELQQLAQVFTKPEPIRNWHIIGPFERERTRPFDLKSVPYEQTFEGETGRVAWREATGEEKHGHIDLEEELEETDHASAFARATVEVEEAMDTELVLGSDDGLRVWVNGEKVFEDMGTRGWEPDQFRVPVSLKKGKNEIVCKIEENTGSWGFSVKYVSREFLRSVQEQ